MFFMYGFHIHIARKTFTLRFKRLLYIVINPIFAIFLLSLHVTSSNNITSVYSVEHIPGVKKKNHNISFRKLNLPFEIQGVHMFDKAIFFTGPIFRVQTSRYFIDK